MSISISIKEVSARGFSFFKSDILPLFWKREDKFYDDKLDVYCETKQQKDMYKRLLKAERGTLQDCEKWSEYLKNTDFIKVYKRINGYAKDINIKNSLEPTEKIIEITGGGMWTEKQLWNAINHYLDSNKISDSQEVVVALKFIEERWFYSNLPVEFLELA